MITRQEHQESRNMERNIHHSSNFTKWNINLLLPRQSLQKLRKELDQVPTLSDKTFAFQMQLHEPRNPVRKQNYHMFPKFLTSIMRHNILDYSMNFGDR